jgi:hypothetical protein
MPSKTAAAVVCVGEGVRRGLRQAFAAGVVDECEVTESPAMRSERANGDP